MTKHPPETASFLSQRQAGVLCHLTSLPSGRLDEQAEAFLRWMVEAGLSVWQMLPLNPPLNGLSPYQSCSAFALNPAFLPEDWLSLFEVYQYSECSFEQYLASPPHWLEDFALFAVLREIFERQSWSQWPAPYRWRAPEVLATFRQEQAEAILTVKKQQYVLERLWHDFKQSANQKGIQLFGDMPIFVAYDSADVWAHPELFKLDEQGQPTVVAGVPPDYFSETGQKWGNPHYNWAEMEKEGFRWWRHRVEVALSQFDLIRLDHFRGLEAVWEIPAEAEDATQGEWVTVPGEALLATLKQHYDPLPIVAEDLGLITPEVRALKEKFQLPGMSVLQFGFDGMPDNPHALESIVPHSVVYTGTHDNATTLGWWQSLQADTQHWVLQRVAQALQCDVADLPPMPWTLIRAGMCSAGNLFMAPLQDYMGLDDRARMNVPGVAEGNWSWQFSWSEISPTLAKEIAETVKICQRLPKAKALTKEMEN